jgi:aspartate aminotransferase
LHPKKIKKAMQLSSLLQRFNEPETLKMAKLGRELRAKGIDIIDLSLGEPDFDTPEHIKQAAIEELSKITGAITRPLQVTSICAKAVCTKLKRDNNLDYKPEK